MPQWPGFPRPPHGLYRTTTQPLVRALATEKGAEWSRRMHPLRLGFELYSDTQPGDAAIGVRRLKRSGRTVGRSRPTTCSCNGKGWFSDWMTAGLNAYRDWRDMLMRAACSYGIYRQPWLQAMLGLRSGGRVDRKGARAMTPIMRRLSRPPDQGAAAHGWTKGGPREAAIRAMIYVRMPENSADERGFEMLRRIRAEQGGGKSLAEFKQELREQYLMLRLDESRARGGHPQPAQRQEERGEAVSGLLIRKVVTAGGPLQAEGRKGWPGSRRLFTSCRNTTETSRTRRCPDDHQQDLSMRSRSAIPPECSVS